MNVKSRMTCDCLHQRKYWFMSQLTVFISYRQREIIFFSPSWNFYQDNRELNSSTITRQRFNVRIKTVNEGRLSSAIACRFSITLERSFSSWTTNTKVYVNGNQSWNVIKYFISRWISMGLWSVTQRLRCISFQSPHNSHIFIHVFPSHHSSIAKSVHVIYSRRHRFEILSSTHLKAYQSINK